MDVSRREMMTGALAVMTSLAFEGWWKRAFGEDLKQRLNREGIDDWMGIKQEKLKEEALSIVGFFEKEYGITVLTPDKIEIIEAEKRYTIDTVTESFTILSSLRQLKETFTHFPPKTMERYVREINLTGTIETERKVKLPGFIGGFVAKQHPKRVTLRIEEVLRERDWKRITPLLRRHSSMHEIVHAIFPSANPAFFQRFFSAAYGERANRNVVYDEMALDKYQAAQSGFSSVYAQTNVFEDVADTLAKLLHPEDQDFIAQLQTDSVLQKKVTFLQNELINVVGLPKTYWQDLYAKKVNMDYWSHHKLLRN